MKKKIQLMVLMLVFAITNSKAQNGQYLPAGIDLHYRSNPFAGNWHLVFGDEFNTYSGPNHLPDVNTWTTYDDYTEPNSVSTYKSANVWVNNGICTLSVKKQPATQAGVNYDYTSAEITSLESGNPNLRQVFERGMFEARIKMSGAPWIHENFWVYGDNGPELGEIDIDELNGWESTVEHNIHSDFRATKGFKGDGGLTNPNMSPTPQSAFYIYTVIWDKFYYYFYINHHLTWVVNKLYYNSVNNNSLPKSPASSPTNAGYYWINDPFYPINASGKVILHIFLQPKDPNSPTPQDAGIPTDMYVDWVRVYRRDDCEESDIVTNPDLLPYHSLDDEHITLGTLNEYDYVSQPKSWNNIVPFWGDAKDCRYRAQSITLAPTFQAYPVHRVFTAGGTTYDFWTKALFEARPCEAHADEYIEPTDMMRDDEWSFTGMGKRHSDDVGMTSISTSQNDGGSACRIYPNPNNGTFTIEVPDGKSCDVKVSNMVGVTVFKAQINNERKHEIRLEDKLPAGTYTVHLMGKDINHVERIVISK